MKRIYFILLLAIFLASCANETAGSTLTAVPTQTLLPDSIPTPRFTPTQEVTETLQATPTETPAPAPDVKLSDLLSYTLDSFTPISHEVRLQLNQDIANGVRSQLSADISNVRPVTFGVEKSPNGVAVTVTTYLSENCVLRYAVNDGGIPMLVWEVVVIGPDGKNIRASFTTSPIPNRDTEERKKWALDMLHGLGAKSWSINFRLLLSISGQQISPNAKLLLTPTQAGDNLQKRIFDTNTGDTPFLLNNATGS